jgi:outer membrane protein OmpA-like peptidoglycan-associated protein
MILIQKKNSHTQKDDFWIGFSDLMTGLMLVFIVISLVFIIKAQEDTQATDYKKEEIEELILKLERLKTKDELSTWEIEKLLAQAQKDKERMQELIQKAKKAKDKLDEVKKNIIVILSNQLAKNNIQVEYNEVKGTVTISQDILFQRKKANLNNEGKAFIQIFATILNKNIFSNKEYRKLIKYIHIEGYASREGGDNSNFNISFERSRNVWTYMTKNSLKYNKIMKKKLNIVSRGEIDANQNIIDVNDRKVVFRFEFYDTYTKIFEGLSR